LTIVELMKAIQGELAKMGMEAYVDVRVHCNVKGGNLSHAEAKRVVRDATGKRGKSYSHGGVNWVARDEGDLKIAVFHKGGEEDGGERTTEATSVG
jgi:hypothetical protein